MPLAFLLYGDCVTNTCRKAASSTSNLILVACVQVGDNSAIAQPASAHLPEARIVQNDSDARPISQSRCEQFSRKFISAPIKLSRLLNGQALVCPANWSGCAVRCTHLFLVPLFAVCCHRVRAAHPPRPSYWALGQSIPIASREVADPAPSARNSTSSTATMSSTFFPIGIAVNQSEI